MPSNLVKPFPFVFYLQINSALGKQKRERETARKRDRTPAPASSRCLNHHRDRTPAPARSHTTMSFDPHPSFPEKHNPIPISTNPHPPDLAPPEAPPRSHPWPTHAQSLSFSIYLSLSLTCWSLSLHPSLRLTEFLNLTNVLFWFLFGFVLIFVCFEFIYWNFLL